MPNTSPHRILQTLNDVGRGLFSDAPSDTHLQQILAAAMALGPVAACSLWRRDAAHAPNTVRLEAAIGGSGRPPFSLAFHLAGQHQTWRGLETALRAVPHSGRNPTDGTHLAAQRDRSGPALCTGGWGG